MNYLPLFNIFPADIVKIIIYYIKLSSGNTIIKFYKQKLIRQIKENVIKDLVYSLIWDELYFTHHFNVIKLNIILNNNWSSKYNRNFWCSFTHILADKLMKEYIGLQMIRNIANKKLYIEISKKLIRLWFGLCEKYNLVLNVTYYNFKSKKGNKPLILPAKNFAKPINNFYNILYTPMVMYNEKNNYYTIKNNNILDTLNEYSLW